MSLIIPSGSNLQDALIVERGDSPVPCHLHALQFLRVAIAEHKRWIRVVKRGHTCELGVPELVQHCQSDWRTIPRCLIFDRHENESIGAVFEVSRPYSPGADFASVAL